MSDDVNTYDNWITRAADDFEAMELLNSFGPNFRYPNLMDLDEDITEKVIKYTKELHTLARKI